MCNWVTIVYSIKFSEHCKPAIMEKSHYTNKQKVKYQLRKTKKKKKDLCVLSTFFIHKPEVYLLLQWDSHLSNLPPWLQTLWINYGQSLLEMKQVEPCSQEVQVHRWGEESDVYIRENLVTDLRTLNETQKQFTSPVFGVGHPSCVDKNWLNYQEEKRNFI